MKCVCIKGAVAADGVPAWPFGRRRTRGTPWRAMGTRDVYIRGVEGRGWEGEAAAGGGPPTAYSKSRTRPADRAACMQQPPPVPPPPTPVSI